LISFLGSITISIFSAQKVFGQPSLWHNKERSMHYLPDGDDFVCVSGKLRFNRALYGGNTPFRVEAGDLPEFAI